MQVPHSVTQLVSSIARGEGLNFAEAAKHATELLRLSLADTEHSKKQIIIIQVPDTDSNGERLMKAMAI